MPRVSLTQQVHHALGPRIHADSVAIDATAGNGHDTLFLASNIDNTGHVYAFDIQAQAIENSRERLSAAGLSDRITLIQAGHEHMAERIAKRHLGTVEIIMFNLGYLPSADKTVITCSTTTILALQAATEILAEKGVISILAYPGHPGGREETEAVIHWAETLPASHFTTTIHHADRNPEKSPLWIEVHKSGSV